MDGVRIRVRVRVRDMVTVPARVADMANNRIRVRLNLGCGDRSG